jgi:hypothetical protein
MDIPETAPLAPRRLERIKDMVSISDRPLEIEDPAVQEPWRSLGNSVLMTAPVAPRVT